NDIKDDFTAKGISKARELWRLDTLPEDERRSYNRHLKHLMDEASSVRTQKIDAEERKAEKERERKKIEATEKALAEAKKESDQAKKESDQAKKEVEKVRAEIKRAEKKIYEMAKGLKDEGVDVAVIKKLTGLSEEDVFAL
ncbi:MAG: hypothetical protein ACK5L5_00005, partial [Bacteroidales bacterium]